jgi:hypothetical protein
MLIFKNLGVNGARSGSMSGSLKSTIARNNVTDKPALVFLELIGNDVCSPHTDLDHVRNTILD